MPRFSLTKLGKKNTYNNKIWMQMLKLKPGVDMLECLWNMRNLLCDRSHNLKIRQKIVQCYMYSFL